MNQKLTLKLNGRTIQKAKAAAKKRGQSLSKMVENYFESVTANYPSVREKEISPRVRALSGIVKVPKNFDPEKEYTDYLLKKYLH